MSCASNSSPCFVSQYSSTKSLAVKKEGKQVFYQMETNQRTRKERFEKLKEAGYFLPFAIARISSIYFLLLLSLGTLCCPPSFPLLRNHSSKTDFLRE